MRMLTPLRAVTIHGNTLQQTETFKVGHDSFVPNISDHRSGGL